MFSDGDFGGIPQEYMTFCNPNSFSDNDENEHKIEANEVNDENFLEVIHKDGTLSDSCNFVINVIQPTIGLYAIDVLCTARVAEIYGPSGAYLETVKGTHVEETESGLQFYLLQHSFDAAVTKFSIKVSCMAQ